MPTGFKKYLTYSLTGLLIIYSGISVYFYNVQERAIFPARTIQPTQSLGFSIPYEELFLSADDGALLSGVYFQIENPKGVVLHFHGNAENLMDMQYVARPFLERGYDFLAMDYRTYGKSSGELSEQSLFDDATLFWQYLLDRGWQDSAILLYGRSIGTGIATDLASRTKPNGLLLYSPYYSIKLLVSDRFSFLPVGLILKYPLNSGSKMRSVSVPVLIIHGDKDRVIPVKHAYQLAEVKGKLEIINGGGHNKLQRYPQFWEAIDKFLERLD